MIRVKWLCFAALAISALGLVSATSVFKPSATNHRFNTALPIYQDSSLTPIWIDEKNQRDSVVRPFPQFRLLDQSGKIVDNQTIEGKIVVANFFFTHCSGVCPSLTSSMRTVSAAFKNDKNVQLLSHSVAPDFEPPPILLSYAQANHIDGRQWKLLTGDKEQINRLAFEGYLVPRSSMGSSGLIHTELIVLLDQKQQVRGVYTGTLKLDIEQLITDMRLLLAT